MRTKSTNLNLLRLRARSWSEAVRLTVCKRVNNGRRCVEPALLLERVEIEGRIIRFRLVSSGPLILISCPIDNSRLSSRSPGIGRISTIPISNWDVAIGHCVGRCGWSGYWLGCRTVGRRGAVVARVVGAVVVCTSSSSFTFLTRNLNFLLRQFFATSHFADLVALVVAARSARGAIVFAHASDAFTATLPLLFRLLAVAIHAGIVAVARHLDVRMFESAGSARDAGHLSVRRFAAGTLHRRGSILSLLLLPAVSGRLSRK